MAAHLLDSSVIIDTLTRRRNRYELLRDLLRQGHTLGCCAINVIEIYAGVRPHEEQRTEDLLRSIEYYELTWEIARTAGLLRRDYLAKGKSITLADATIAAVALSHNLTLITDNVKDYPMPGLRLCPLSDVS